MKSLVDNPLGFGFAGREPFAPPPRPGRGRGPERGAKQVTSRGGEADVVGLCVHFELGIQLEIEQDRERFTACHERTIA